MSPARGGDAAAYPRIAPVPPGTPRPFWSIMIPVYNCALNLLQSMDGGRPYRVFDI